MDKQTLEAKIESLGWKFETAQKILDAIDEGAFYEKDFLRHGISRDTVVKYAPLLGLELPLNGKSSYLSSKLNRARKIVAVKEALEAGFYYVAEIAPLIEMTKSGVSYYANIIGVELPKRKRGRPLGIQRNTMLKSAVRSLLVEGQSSITEIADRLGRSRQHIWDVLDKNRNLRELIEENRDVKKCKNHGCRNYEYVAAGIVQLMYKKALREGNLAYQKAIEYKYSNGLVKSEFGKLVDLFENYYSAKDEGRKITLVGLSRQTGLSFSATRNILDNVLGDEVQHMLKQKRRLITKEKAEAILRAGKLGMPSTDIGYFMGMCPAVLAKRWRGSERKQALPARIFHFAEGQNDALTYRVASQVYEAKDAGFTIDEISEYVGKRKEIVEYALNNWQGICGKIINLLDTLFPEKKHKNPYL